MPEELGKEILSQPLLLIAGMLVLVIIIKRGREYINNTYYQITKNSYASLEDNSGLQGEYLVYKYLKKFEKRGAKFLFNLYIPRGDGKTTEIDAVMICHQGIVVFESKNYHGWIWGSEARAYWCQVLRGKDGQEHYRDFYNPIRQNQTHIRSLKKIVGQQIHMYSVIVFSEECRWKEIEVESKAVFVTKYDEVREVVSQICNDFSHELLRKSERKEIYEKLYPYSQADRATKKRHKKEVKQRF